MLRLTDEHWELIRKHFPEESYPDDRPGRKPIPARKVLEAVLWILNTGAQWHMLPQSYPNYKTVHRRFQQWCQNEVIRGALTELANTLRDHVAEKLGKFCRPKYLTFTQELPKTRSGKIMRRLLRDIAEGRMLGDTTTLADSSIVSELQARAKDEASKED